MIPTIKLSQKMNTEDLISRLRDRIRSDHAGVQRPDPPVSDEAWRETEAVIGFPLPPLMRELYMRVGNGGFGPGYGLRGAIGGATDDNGWDLVEYYRIQREGDQECPEWKWPAGLVGLNDWGCGIASCVDCTDPGYPIIDFDPNGLDTEDKESWRASFVSTGVSFDEWISAWASGADLNQPERRPG
jgi:hypothetical protein